MVELFGFFFLYMYCLLSCYNSMTFIPTSKVILDCTCDCDRVAHISDIVMLKSYKNIDSLKLQ